MSYQAWKEEWEVVPQRPVNEDSSPYVRCCYEGRDDETIATMWTEGGPIGTEDLPRLRLSSAAPDMARVLMDLRGNAECPVCGSCVSPVEPAWKVPPEPHAPDCALVAALRKAGMLP
jgi:hypothetical protein